MSALDGRIDRLYPELSARERIGLILQSVNEEQERDSRIRGTMPNEQVGEFNRYLGQLRGVARGLGPYALMLEQEVAHVRTQFLLLSV